MRFSGPFKRIGMKPAIRTSGAARFVFYSRLFFDYTNICINMVPIANFPC